MSRAPGRRFEAVLPDPTEVAEGELRKSGDTRRRILEAGTALLAEQGYKKLSTPLVAQAAGMTRAAMLYHFGSRLDLVTAIVQHVTRRRIELYADAMRGLPHDAGFLARAIDVAWEQLETPEFAAFAELAQAARTDPELAAIVRPALAAFDGARREAAEQIFPAELVAASEFDLRRDIARFLSEGVVQQDAIVRNKAERIGALKRLLHLLITTPEGAALMQRAVGAE